MARIRTIKPEFVESESIGKLSRDARLLFILLWTIVDDDGRSRASSRFLASRLYPYDDDAMKKIAGWMDELVRGGFIRSYEVEGDAYLDIPKWLKHQKIDHPSKSRLPEYRETSRDLARDGEAIAPHTLDLGPVPRTEDLGPTRASAAATQEPDDDRRITLPSDWRPSIDSGDYARDKGLDPATTGEAFTDYFTQGRGRNEKRTRTGWEKRWRVWCNTDAERRPARVPGLRPAAPSSDAGAFARAGARLGNVEPVR